MAAIRLEVHTAADVVAWVGGEGKAKAWTRPPMRAVTGLTIETPAGPKNAPYGSWVVQRADGTFDVLTAAVLATEITW